MSALRIVVACLVISCSANIALPGQHTGPPRRTVVEVDYGPPPQTLDQLWQKSPIVVRGRVVNSRQRIAVPDRPRSAVVTEHRVQVVELLKGPSPVGLPNEISVLQIGGTVEANGSIVVTDPGPMPIFGRGDEILFFLMDWVGASGFGIVDGPAGAYLLTSPNVILPGTVQHFRSAFGGRLAVPTPEFLATIRSLSKESQVQAR